MTNEQWLVYLYSVYPNGGFTIVWVALLSIFCIIMFFLLGEHFIDYDDSNKEKSNLSKLGKKKYYIPLFLSVMIFLSNLVPTREQFLYIVATPYVVDAGKSLADSFKDPTSKAYKINQLMDKALDKAITNLENKLSNEVTKDSKTSKIK
jgi:cell division protein FtsW (lipid II flippase)